jgi:hypothetical protein
VPDCPQFLVFTKTNRLHVVGKLLVAHWFPICAGAWPRASSTSSWLKHKINIWSCKWMEYEYGLRNQWALI